MKIIWSNFASESLKEIYLYHKEVASESIARRLKTNIFNTTRQLIKHPLSGQIEEILAMLEQEHRYLVKGNYKIIYREIKEGILITDIFDTRQDPIKINNQSRTPSR
ncbi:MAG: type II toxin-antitoxin system RelE/ParE family toxin [Bacteroidales bacterium]|nr:type II toxin-antitoxin system RelE/ParE family toxin [Bacteroidales bacterium]MBN2749264.1 type II toxin-antitoxin system RelE/ParE family toxin [Bacteroidales bacterium]